MSDSLRPHGLQHARRPCPSPTPRVYSNSCPLSRQCHPTISSSVIPFSSSLQSFPTSGFFKWISSLHQWWKYWRFSFSISPSNEYSGLIPEYSIPLGWTSWISLQSKGLSRVFSKPQFKGINSPSGWITLGLPHPKVVCTSRVHTAQASWCSETVLSQVGPAFCPNPVLRHSGFRVLHKSTDSDGLCVLCPSQVQAAQPTGCLATSLSQVGHGSYAPPRSLGFLGVPWGRSPRCAVCLLWGADHRVWHSW